MLFLIQLVLLCLVYCWCNNAKPTYCLPTNSFCWPTLSEINQFASLLDGSLIQPSNGSEYYVYVNMTQDLLYRNQYPSFFVSCESTKDIQNAVKFASSHNIEISILSTGHSWAGLSTANFSLQINLSKMKNYAISDDHNSITVETGLQWGQVYEIVDKIDRVIVGGADPTVGVGGYSLGGGHSVLTPFYGLSADFITDLYMVDATGDIVHVYNTSGNNQTIDDLFWSLRGAGGGTYGVIINITFAIHTPIKNYVYTGIYCEYSFFEYPEIRKHFILDDIFENLWNLIKTETLDPKWGGYLLTYTGDKLLISNFTLYGESNYARTNAEPLLHLNEPYNNSDNHLCDFIEYKTYLEYASKIPGSQGGEYEIQFNYLIPPTNLTMDFTNLWIEFLNSTEFIHDGFMRAVTSILVSGNVQNFDDDFNSVNPGWRHSSLLFVPALIWFNDKHTNNAIKHSNEYEEKFRESAYGMYQNEENYWCADCDWKTLFWGSGHYQKLLTVKQKWDKNNVFWCYHCVGSDAT